MDRLDAMSVFVATVETGSLSAAGRRLGMPLATVSRKVADLEAQLHARLLHRSTRKLTLTDAGENYLAACKRILGDIDEAERAAAGEYRAPKGDLVVTAPIVFGRLHLLPIVAEFLAAYPDVDVRLVLGDRALNLLDDHVDLALRIGNLPDSEHIARQIGVVRLVTCASAGHVKKHGAPLHPRDLIAHDCVTFDGLTRPQVWTFRESDADISVPIHSRLVVNTAEAAIDAAVIGVGIVRVMSYQVAEPFRARKLKLVLDAFELPPLPVHLLYARQGQLPLKLRAFIDFVLPRLAACF